MSPVALEQWFLQNQNLLAKLNCSEETSSEGKVLLSAVTRNAVVRITV